MRGTLQPEWCWAQGAWQKDWRLEWDESGRLTRVGPGEDRSLPGVCLLPGRVNSHSHAFQRCIRGRTEFRHADRPSDDFWSWREQMYAAAMRLDPDALEAVARLLYLEMAESGITTVGEFHYLHHDPAGHRYNDPDELAHRLLAAADWAGVKLVVLRCAYARAGFGQPANPRQIRFLDRDWEECVAAVDRLHAEGHAVGIAPHSVRAVPAEWLPFLEEFARRGNLPLHMHLSEQPAEIDQCLAEHGCRPVELVDRLGMVDERFTAVHAIHLEAAEIEALGRATVCSCPTTERNLGDGIVRAERLRAAGANFTFGTDSQAQIDLWEDARQLDYHLRLADRQRAVLDHPAGQLEGWLLEAGAAGGAASLRQPCGRLQVGLRADMVLLDLAHPRLAQAHPAGLLWAAGSETVRQVWRAGRPLLEDGVHPRREEAVRGFLQVMQDA